MVADLKQLVRDAVCEVASVNKSNITFSCVEIQAKRKRNTLTGIPKDSGIRHYLLSISVCNTFVLSEAGQALLENPHLFSLPDAGIRRAGIRPLTKKSQNEPIKRKGKGCQAVEGIRSPMSSRKNWYEISSETDYQFPGIFEAPFPQRLGYCPDVSTLPLYKSGVSVFLYAEIQFGRGKAHNPQRVTMSVDGKEEAVRYRIVPCGGVKQCAKYGEGCTHVVSTREIRNDCQSHPKEKLVRTANCPVEFIYIQPDDESDPRRWLTGITRGGKNEEQNLHNHPCHAWVAPGSFLVLSSLGYILLLLIYLFLNFSTCLSSLLDFLSLYHEQPMS